MISPELLRRFPFFNFMDDKQLKAVAMIAEEKTYAHEEEIVAYNSPAEKLFFLVEGTASYYYIVTSEHDPYYTPQAASP